MSVSEKVDTTAVFCAIGVDTEKTKYDNPIVFHTVTVDEGGCYDNNTGEFTTTVPGTYVFTVTVGSREEGFGVIASIMVDDTVYTKVYGSYKSTGSSSVSVQLGLGQRVWVKAGSYADEYYPDDLCFTGALVQPQLRHAVVVYDDDDDDDDDDGDDDDDDDDYHRGYCDDY